MSATEPLFPDGAAAAAARERWGVEITGLGDALAGPSVDVRVTLIDHESGKRVGAVVLPFTWLRDVASGGTALANIRPGVWS